MINLNNKQKIISIIILFIMIITIFYYFISQNNNSTDYSYFENNVDNISADNTEENELENNIIVIHITGSIKKPGVIKLNYGARIIDAIEAAGGLTEDANLDDVNLAYILEDAQKLYIPNKNDYIDENDVISSDVSESIIKDINNSLNSNLKININTATQTELELLPRNRS